ncbi:MAG: molybdenum cofactor guanylyltransferase MobA [Hyphomicrobiales bacterium]
MATAVILAGGRSHRMGSDKAVVDLHGKRLIDHVIERLSPQVDRIMLSAGQDYGTGLTIIGDADAFQGPVAGLFGIAEWLAANEPACSHFLTVPVDGPFLPADLARKLTAQPDQVAIAQDEAGTHPTFANWTLAALDQARPSLPSAPSLHRLAKLTNARPVLWSGNQNFINLNTPDDLKGY